MLRGWRKHWAFTHSQEGDGKIYRHVELRSEMDQISLDEEAERSDEICCLRLGMYHPRGFISNSSSVGNLLHQQGQGQQMEGEKSKFPVGPTGFEHVK